MVRVHILYKQISLDNNFGPSGLQAGQTLQLATSHESFINLNTRISVIFINAGFDVLYIDSDVLWLMHHSKKFVCLYFYHYDLFIYLSIFYFIVYIR